MARAGEGGGGGGRSEGGGGRALRVKVPPKVNGIVAHKDQRSSKVCNILCVIYLFIIIIINFVFDGWIVSRHLLEAIVCSACQNLKSQGLKAEIWFCFEVLATRKVSRISR